MKIKCVLIDDEPLALKVLLNYFQNFPEFEIVKTFSNALEALDYLNNHSIDALFLDINMPLMSGFELIHLYNNKANTKIIITTAFREFAAESYDLDVLDYLVKPIPLPRFIKCLSKVTGEFQNRTAFKQDTHRLEPHIFIKVDKKMVKINIDEILFIEGMKEYIKVVTTEKTYITHKSLSSLTEELPEERFMRIHKSYSIAIDKVKTIEGNRIQIASYTLPIGRNFSKDVKSKILE
ncbi:MAG: LytR/AlgR family response regulator transcription factor [Flavobacterium sp.]